MKLLIAFACCVAITSAMKPGGGRPPKVKGKTEKQVFDLCSAYDSGYVTVTDPGFNDIFSDDVIGGFCDDFFDALNRTAKEVLRNIDGERALGKACKSFEKQYPEEPMEGALVGFAEICNATYEARAMSLNDKKSMKAIKDIKKMCMAQEADNLEIKVSNFTEVFEDMEDFCGLFMNDTTLVMPKMRGDRPVDGIRVLGGVCRWYGKKFSMYDAEGTLAGLEDICDDYNEVKMALEEEEEEEEDEEEA